MSDETALFSSAGQDVIQRKADIDDEGLYETQSLDPQTPYFEEYYSIDRTVKEIQNGGYKKIALQFPDALLPHSVPVYKALQSQLGVELEIYVLADTSYGSCCVDEVAAQHVDADVMVHYGHACLSKPYRLPVIYVFGRSALDVDDCVDRFMDALKSASNSPTEIKAITLKHDVVYTHHADPLLSRLRQVLDPLQLSVAYDQIPLKLDPQTQPNPDAASRDIKDGGENQEDRCILYIGGESLGLTHLLMTHATHQVYTYNPKTKTAALESVRTNRTLMRRYVAVQKARDADVFGIIVGTLGVASYLPLISHIRQLLNKTKKKSYTISVGKLNPAKLGNFLEIECFVLVACPENSVIDSKEFHRPIVTPYELEVALQAEQVWTGRYVLDFDQLLAETKEPAEAAVETNSDDDPDQPVFSLVTGTYRHAKRYEQNDPTEDAVTAEGSNAVIPRNQDNALAKFASSAAAQYLQSRSYQGLETRIGEDAPSVLEQGRSGIAKGYQDDHENPDEAAT
ncbi:hypothetical protein HGRIS_010921 [Hohenbuehelia grisea]|uniref:2-(3-amino-3-carboxypropyl)histidine synthase subunit 2 n=1 Tax=Hohenbuehelia grisea TaxID=104357 RepID=A0ABR3IY78_9AGAR